MRILHDDKGYTVLELMAEYKCGHEQSVDEKRRLEMA